MKVGSWFVTRAAVPLSQHTVVNAVAALLAVSLLLWIPGFMWSQGSDPPTQLIRRALTEHGARWESGNVNSVAKGTLTLFAMSGPKATFEMTLSQQGKTKVQRTLTPAKGATIRQGTDGSKSWNSQGTPFDLAKPSQDVLQFIESQTSRSLQALFSATDRSARDVGTSKKGRAIEVTEPEGRKTTYFLNTETSVISRVEFTVGQTKDLFGKTISVVEWYVLSDFRKVEGLLTPFKVERYRNATKIEEMQFTSVSYAGNVADDVFRP